MPRRADSDLDARALTVLLGQQAGVVSRRQVLGLGGTCNDIRRRLAARAWAGVHPGVYVDHTGPPSRLQLQWATVLHYWPAALHRESALEAHGLSQDRGAAPTAVWVMVDASRRVTAVEGVRLERVVDAAQWIMPNRHPPRAAVDFALLKASAARDEAGAVALVSDCVHQGLTTAPRLAATLDRLPRLPGRALLLELLRDVGGGAQSALERRYLRDVERAHGLPAGVRQLREVTTAGTVVFRDVAYPAQGVFVELDGAFGHRDLLDRWGDLSRDLEAAAGGRTTLRAGWAQVLDACRLAAVVGRVMAARGWEGSVVPCGDVCPVGRLDRGGSGRTYRHDPPRSLSASA